MTNGTMPIVRVAVIATAADGSRATDMALPTGVPLRELLPAVKRMALSSDDDLGDGTPTALSLAPIGGAPFSIDATLDTVGVVDGDLLALQAIPVGPPAPRIVEDIGDAAVIFSAARERPWGPVHIERFATVAIVVMILAATGLSAVHRVATDSNVGLIVASAVAVVTVLGALLSRAANPRMATALSLAALPPVAVAFALAVPGDFGAAHLLLAAAGLAAWSIVSIAVADRAIAWFTAVATVGAGVVVAAGAATIWSLGSVTVGSVIVVLALVVTVQAAQLSAMWARFPAPSIPAPGDPTPDALPIKVLEDLPRRVRLSDAHQTGFIAGGVLLGAAGALIIAVPPSVSYWAWYVVAAVALGSALRARIWDSAPCKAWLLAQPILLAVAFLGIFAHDGRYSAAWWALGALAMLTVVWMIAAAFPRVATPETYSLPMRRLVGFLAAGVDASLIPVLAFLVGLFALVLNR